jgi:lipopolysaccharide export system protein LptA
MPGVSTLVFTSDRGLQGQRRRSDARITVTCSENMAFDSDADTNEVSFVGNVVVRDGDDRLEAQRLTLYLDDEPAAAKATGVDSLGDWIRALPDTVRWTMRVPGAARDTWRAAQDAEHKRLGQPQTPRARIRKQPLRLVAHQATLISETYDPGRSRPIVMQLITAPELTVEIPQRTVRTLGETTLGMTSLRLGGGAPEEVDVLGLPSAMITSGPSHTAMRAGRSMTYVFAEDGPERRDSVLFEGGVGLVHVAGKQMDDLYELIPELRANPAATEHLKDRKTQLTCDRVELLLQVAQTPDGRQRSPRMTWMNARGDVYLVDQQGANHRAVTAGQIEFDRTEQTVRVVGDKVMNMLAKIETWNPEKNVYEVPAMGPSFVIHLDTNTVMSDHVSGELRR